MKKIIFIIVIYALLLFMPSCKKCPDDQTYYIPNEKKISIKVGDSLFYTNQNHTKFDTIVIIDIKKEIKDFFSKESKNGKCYYNLNTEVCTYKFKNTNDSGNIVQGIANYEYIYIYSYFEGDLNLSLTNYEKTYISEYLGTVQINSKSYENVYQTIGDNYIFYVNDKYGIIQYINIYTQQSFTQL